MFKAMMPSAHSFPMQPLVSYPLPPDIMTTTASSVQTKSKLSFSIDSLVGSNKSSSNGNSGSTNNSNTNNTTTTAATTNNINNSSNSNSNNTSSNPCGNGSTNTSKSDLVNGTSKSDRNGSQRRSPSPPLKSERRSQRSPDIQQSLPPSAHATASQGPPSSSSSSHQSQHHPHPHHPQSSHSSSSSSDRVSSKSSPAPPSLISNGPPFSTTSTPITPTPISGSMVGLGRSPMGQFGGQHSHQLAAAAAAAAMNPQFGLFSGSGGPRNPLEYHQAAALYPWFMARQSPFVSNPFHGSHFGAPISPFLLPPYRKPKRIRTAFSPGQLLKLEQAFEKNHYVVGAERKQLAQCLNLTETQVKVWFQNRRTKHKRQKQEDDEKLDSNGSERGKKSPRPDDDDEDIEEDESDLEPDGMDHEQIPGGPNSLYYHHQQQQQQHLHLQQQQQQQHHPHHHSSP